MPEYYRHELANGKTVMETAPTIQWGYLIYLTVLRLCQYFGAKEECGFCDINHNWRQHKREGRPYTGVKPVADVLEALALIDRYDAEKVSRAYTLTGGSVTSSVEGLAEADFYGRYAAAIEERFPGRWIGKVVAQALPRAEVQRYKDYGISIYHPNYEVWDKRLFALISPGKERYVGREEWHRRILDAAEVFGPRHVIPNFVAGVEMAKPFGFTSVEDALASTGEGLDFFMSRAITPRFTTWCPEPATPLGRDNPNGAPLEYHVRLLERYRETLERHGLAPPPGYGVARAGQRRLLGELVHGYARSRRAAARANGAGVSGLAEIAARVEAGGRLEVSQAATLWREADDDELKRLAQQVRGRWHEPDRATYMVMRIINYTNVCVAQCDYCAFYVLPGQEGGYVLSREQVFAKIDELLELGGDLVAFNGGFNPKLPLGYYAELFGAVRERYGDRVEFYALTVAEFLYLADNAGLTHAEAARRLRDAGVHWVTGGGSEILTEDFRKRHAKFKYTVEEYLRAQRAIVEAGIRTTATMVIGFDETLDERLEHLERTRAFQDACLLDGYDGLFSFLCWTYKPYGTAFGGREIGAAEYRRHIALSRIFLDNVKHVRTSVLTQNEEAFSALAFGADDFDLPLEDEVTQKAGARIDLDLEHLLSVPRALGYTVSYRRAERPAPAAVAASPSEARARHAAFSRSHRRRPAWARSQARLLGARPRPFPDQFSEPSYLLLRRRLGRAGRLWIASYER